MSYDPRATFDYKAAENAEYEARKARTLTDPDWGIRNMSDDHLMRMIDRISAMSGTSGMLSRLTAELNARTDPEGDFR